MADGATFTISLFTDIPHAALIPNWGRRKRKSNEKDSTDHDFARPVSLGVRTLKRMKFMAINVERVRRRQGEVNAVVC